MLNSRVSSFQLQGVLDVCFVVILKDHLLLVTGDPDPKSNLQYLWNLFLSFSPPLPFVRFGFFLGNLWEGCLIVPLSLCIVSQLQMRHGNQIEIKIPACCWQSWAGACGLDVRLESVLLFLALQVYIWRPPEVKIRSAELSVTQLVRGVKTVFYSHTPLASLPHTQGQGQGQDLSWLARHQCPYSHYADPEAEP